ncbi:MAG TPA: 30S ribosomal protein S20 [Candidatus Omnitrophota bacterium]|nr:30S ribosomal protein S20 [Candidatus Omnitrophota bacterium]
MANKRAAIKSLRQTKKRHDRNTAARSELRTLSKKARVLISENKKEEADTLLKKLESNLDRAVKKNVIKKGCASRRISRLRSAWSKISAKK